MHRPLPDSAPQQVGPYRLVGVIGRGGSAIVYAAQDERGRPVAVKLIHRQLAADPVWRRRFAREVRLALTVASRHTAQLLDADTTAERPWLASELVHGPTLHAEVNTRGPLAGGRLDATALALAGALAAIHSHKVIHRDLTPSNVVLADDGPRVIDMGLAMQPGDERLTSDGSVAGTPGWIAPEVRRGGVPGARSDVFSFGLIVCFAATGKPPYPGITMREVQKAIQEGRSPELRDVPGRLREVVRLALQSEGADRPSASELTTLLVGGDHSSTVELEAATTRLIDQAWESPATAVLTTRERLAPVPAMVPDPTAVAGRTRSPDEGWQVLLEGMAEDLEQLRAQARRSPPRLTIPPCIKALDTGLDRADVRARSGRNPAPELLVAVRSAVAQLPQEMHDYFAAPWRPGHTKHDPTLASTVEGFHTVADVLRHRVLGPSDEPRHPAFEDEVWRCVRCDHDNDGGCTCRSCTAVSTARAQRVRRLLGVRGGYPVFAGGARDDNAPEEGSHGEGDSSGETDGSAGRTEPSPTLAARSRRGLPESDTGDSRGPWPRRPTWWAVAQCAGLGMLLAGATSMLLGWLGSSLGPGWSQFVALGAVPFVLTAACTASRGYPGSHDALLGYLLAFTPLIGANALAATGVLVGTGRAVIVVMAGIAGAELARRPGRRGAPHPYVLSVTAVGAVASGLLSTAAVWWGAPQPQVWLVVACLVMACVLGLVALFIGTREVLPALALSMGWIGVTGPFWVLIGIVVARIVWLRYLEAPSDG